MLVLAQALAGQSDAPDMVQEACLIGMRRYEEFSPEGNFEAWMATILRNVVLNHQRSERRRLRRLKSWWQAKAEDSDAKTPGPHSAPAHAVDPMLVSALERLEETARICLLLRVVQERSYSQISTMLLIPEATVRSHVYRARVRLARRLESAP